MDKLDIFDRIMLLPGLRLLYEPYKRYKSILLYIFFGGLTTVVSIGSFTLFDLWLHMDPLIANVLSWILAVLFSYVTNRIWVFESRKTGALVFKEMASFFAGRLVTLGIEELLLLVFVTMLSFNSVLVKTLGQIVVLVLNYLISKFLVFSKGRNNNHARENQF